MPIGRGIVRRGSAAPILAAPLLGTAPGAAGSGPVTFATPGYELRVATDRLTLTTVRAGRTALATAAGAFRFRTGGDWCLVREVTDSSREGDTVRVTAATDLPDVTVYLRITLRSDRYDVNWSLSGATADVLSTAYDLDSAGHWYGHGENTDQTVQPWPLDSGQLVDTAFSPASYQVVSPFWYTADGTGLRVDTDEPMDVRINSGGNGLGEFTVARDRPAASTVFVEDTPAEVYRDHRAGRQARALRHFLRPVRHPAVELLGPAPLFFDFPKDEAGYTVADEWMLGPAVPKLDEGTPGTSSCPPVCGATSTAARSSAARRCSRRTRRRSGSPRRS